MNQACKKICHENRYQQLVNFVCERKYESYQIDSTLSKTGQKS